MLQLLAAARPFDDPFTDAFGNTFILKPLWALGYKPRVDVRKNVWLRIGESETLFSCHYDSAHYKGGWQQLEVDEDTGIVWKADGQALGGDDGGGVWVLRELIAAGKPGLYLFHNGEERGCVGSKYIADNNPKMLDGIKRAIAFDRRGRHSIITEMSCGRVCSDDFAKALAKDLDMGHRPDPTGSMTDTGKYFRHVPECTNVSVGYLDEHGPNESLDITYLFELVEALKSVDFEALPTVRDPKAPATYSRYTGTTYSYPNYSRPVWTEQAVEAAIAAAENDVAQVPADLDQRTDEAHLRDLFIECFGVQSIPDPREEPADFVDMVLSALSFMTEMTAMETKLIEAALYAYCELDPEGVRRDLIDMLEG